MLSEKASKRLNERGVWFRGTTKCPADIDNIKLNISEFHYYAFIFHKPDDDDDRLHIHYVLQCNGTRSLKSVADTLGVDGQYLQKSTRPRGAIRYLIHLDNPEKEQYKFDDIFTNDKDFTRSFMTDNNQCSSSDLFEDLVLVRNHRMSCSDFISKYQWHLDRLPLYQRIKTLEVIMKFGD